MLHDSYISVCVISVTFLLSKMDMVFLFLFKKGLQFLHSKSNVEVGLNDVQLKQIVNTFYFYCIVGFAGTEPVKQQVVHSYRLPPWQLNFLSEMLTQRYGNLCTHRDTN